MRKYYTRPCNFYYGNHARNLVKKKKALHLAGNSNIAFNQLEIFQRKSKGIVTSELYPINKINSLAKEKKDCNNIKKFNPKYLACKISNLTSKKDGVTLDTTDVKEKKYIIDWFKKKK